jgi:hypothetical protein
MEVIVVRRIVTSAHLLEADLVRLTTLLRPMKRRSMLRLTL